MQSFKKSNLQSIKHIFTEKTDVILENTSIKYHLIKKSLVLATVLVCCLTMTAFGVSMFSSLSGDDLSLSSTYEGNGIVSIQVENKSDKDLIFQEQLKLMRWSTSEEITPLTDHIIFHGTKIEANSMGVMTIDLSDAYDFSKLEQPLVDDHYYFILTNHNFLFGQDWMCSIEFAEPVITPIQEPTPMAPAEADHVSVSKISKELQHYFDAYVADPLEWRERNEQYLSDCARLLSDLDGNVISSVSPYLLVDMLEPGVIFDETVPADKQHWLIGEHYKTLDGYNLPVGSSTEEKALVLSAYIPQRKGDIDGGVEIPLVYIMTYETEAIQNSGDYVFIRGQLLTVEELEQYKVYEDTQYACFNVTELFYTDLQPHVESMVGQRTDVYFDEQVWERVQNIYNYGLVGKNGAGKTTLMRIICGLTQQSQGSYTLLGKTNDDAVRKNMGMLIEKPGIYEHMTALENLNYFSLLLSIQSQDHHRILEMVGLQNAGKKKASQFSLGMKQRLGIAISLLGNPDFLILDEPINGLDPEGVYEMRKMLETLNREHGTTIMIASHILSELHKLATDYAIIDGGHLIDEFSKDTLESACSSGVQVTVEPEYLQNAKTLIASRYPDVPCEICSKQSLQLHEKIDPADLNQFLVENKVRVCGLRTNDGDIERFFVEKLSGGRAV